MSLDIPKKYQIRQKLPHGLGYVILDTRRAYNFDPIPEDGITFYVDCDNVGSHTDQEGFHPPNRSGHFEQDGVHYTRRGKE